METSKTRYLLSTLVPVVCLSVEAGCDPTGCTPSIDAGLAVRVTDAQTGQGITSAVLTLTEGQYTEALTGPGTASGSYVGAFERAGTYTLTAEAQGYVSQTIQNVVVESGTCHVKGVNLNVELTPS